MALLTTSSVALAVSPFPATPFGPQCPHLQNRKGELHQCRQVPSALTDQESWVCPTPSSSMAASLALCVLKGLHVAVLAWQGTDLFRRKHTQPTILHSPLQPTICPTPLMRNQAFVLPLTLSVSYIPHPTQIRTVRFPEPRRAATNCGGEFSLTMYVSPPCNYKGFWVFFPLSGSSKLWGIHSILG